MRRSLETAQRNVDAYLPFDRLYWREDTFQVMKQGLGIRLLAASGNERGDLLTRVTKDLFFALGYDDLRLNVHRSGREVDIEGRHRFEPRRVVAECKAHSQKMGGENLNKFFGVVARERNKHAPVPVAGYFVSLGGFTETATEQEIETGDARLILLDGYAVVEELERCRVIVSRAEALERAGRCVQICGCQGLAVHETELLGHELGYVWAAIFTSNKERTHLAV